MPAAPKPDPPTGPAIDQPASGAEARSVADGAPVGADPVEERSPSPSDPALGSGEAAAAPEPPVTASSPPSLVVTGAYRLDLEDRDTTPPGHLTFVLDDVGVHVDHEAGSAAWAAPWTDLTSLGVTDEARLPDGSRGVVVRLTSEGSGNAVVVLPTPTPTRLERALRAERRRRGLRAEQPETRPRALVAAIVVVLSAGGVTALLLAAGHML